MLRTILYEAALARPRLAGPLSTVPAGTAPAHLTAPAAQFEELLDDFIAAFDPVLNRVLGNIEEHGLHITGSRSTAPGPTSGGGPTPPV